MRALLLTLLTAVLCDGCATARPESRPYVYIDFPTATESQLRAACEAWRETGDVRHILATFGDGLVARLNCSEIPVCERDCEGGN